MTNLVDIFNEYREKSWSLVVTFKRGHVEYWLEEINGDKGYITRPGSEGGWVHLSRLKARL